jgi:cytidylyltransferase-like protein
VKVATRSESGNSTLREILLTGKTDLYVVATGAGTNLLTSLWSTPGASAYLKGFHFPYDSAETDAFLGYQPDGYCTEKTAILMAIEAYVRSRRLYYLRGQDRDPATISRNAIGLAVTASVASMTEHRGEHRAFIATVSNLTPPVITARKIVLPKGVGLFARMGDDAIVSDATVKELDQTLRDYAYSVSSYTEEQIKEFLFEKSYPLMDERLSLLSDKVIFIPGNFNPIHQSHLAMGQTLRTAYGFKPIYTICIDPPHKPQLSLIDMLDRVAMFRALAPRAGLLFTRKDPLFIDKMRAYPNSTWAVGGDTLDRLLDPKWGPTTDEVCDVIESTGSKIYFFPSKHADGWIDTPSIFKKYTTDKLAVLLHKKIMRVGVELPDIRSSSIRAAVIATLPPFDIHELDAGSEPQR